MPPSKLSVLSVRMEARMRERVGGRMWMGAHMRRGVSKSIRLFLLTYNQQLIAKLFSPPLYCQQDFIKYSWAMNSDAYQHFDRIKGWMDTGVKYVLH